MLACHQEPERINYSDSNPGQDPSVAAESNYYYYYFNAV